MIDDSELLRRYAEDCSEDAFAELVRRHLGFVYGVAVRRVGNDAQLAREVCQEVFTALAAKAAAVARQPVLKGWLHTAARFSAARAVRSESRRRQREQEAYTMNEINDDAGLRKTWEQLRPVIDEMLGELRQRDREAVLLRFFEELTFAQLGQRLKISEDAARVRVARALDELSGRLSRRGIASTAAVIATCLGSQAAIAAPAGWTAAITGTAMAGASAGTWLGVFMGVTKTQVGIASAVMLAGVSAVWWQVGKNTGPLAEPRTTVTQQSKADARNEAQQEQAAAAQPRVTAAPSPSPTVVASPVREPLPVASQRPIRTWVNAGRATPEATIETLMFAGAKGDVDLIVSGIKLGAQFNEALQSQLPAAEHGQANAPERLLARMMVTSTAAVTDMQVIGRIDVDDNTARLRVRLANADRSGQEREFTFRKSADGWRMLVDR
jgi:RNA polymerase sigma factor (sigma-70 family)